MKAPLLFLGWGNPSRGDDALGPLLCERLAAARGGSAAFEVQQDFQLQVEDALDVAGRTVVVFIDAAASGAAPFEFVPVAACADRSAASHALSPQAVMATAAQVFGAAPPAYLMAVRGDSFGLGAPLSAAAAARLEDAWVALSGIAAATDPLAACARLAGSGTPPAQR